MSRQPMTNDFPQEKWNQRYREAAIKDAQPAQVLHENQHLLPGSGTALELACGLGANAMLLAQRGLQTHAWDSSRVAIDKLCAKAASEGLSIAAKVRDVVQHPPEHGRYDVIVVSRFLERSLAQPIVDALRPGGLLFYQTFTRSRVTGRGPEDACYRLADNELLAMFSSLRALVYRDEGRVGDLSKGLRDEAMLVGMKKVAGSE